LRVVLRGVDLGVDRAARWSPLPCTGQDLVGIGRPWMGNTSHSGLWCEWMDRERVPRAKFWSARQSFFRHILPSENRPHPKTGQGQGRPNQFLQHTTSLLRLETINHWRVLLTPVARYSLRPYSATTIASPRHHRHSMPEQHAGRQTASSIHSSCNHLEKATLPCFFLSFFLLL
jgi:hypothetical protein